MTTSIRLQKGQRRHFGIAYAARLAARRSQTRLLSLQPRLLRAGDLVVGMLLTLVLSPAWLARALLALVRSGRLLDRETRIGRHGEPYMHVQFAGKGGGRKLAGLWNLLKGDVSLAGPRPLRPEELTQLPAECRERLLMRPGLISPYRTRAAVGIAYENEFQCDREYYYRQTPGSGLTLAARGLLSNALRGGRELPAPEQLNVLDVRISNISMESAIAWCVERIEAGAPTQLAFVNPDCLNQAYSNAEYRRVLHRAERVLPDGIGLQLAARMLGKRMAANVNGTDLFPRLCARLAETGHSIFLLGARDGIAAAAAKEMQRRFPELQVAGSHHGYFGEQDESAVIEAINASGADVLLVAMGAPRQECWLARNADALQPVLRMGVGGLFDFYSGRIPRAPLWMREIGMEWVWRLVQEPTRMWRRYVIGNPLFLWRVLGQQRREQHAVYRFRHAPLRQRLAVQRARLQQSSWRSLLRLGHAAKRTLDVLASGGALLLLSPLLLIIVAAIALESPGPVLFRQARVGRNGKLFTMLKFRSMYQDAEQRKAALMAQNEMQGGVLFKMRDDPRITRVGRIIRRTSLDELPQLWNVLRGDMSVVGPRPALPAEVDQYRIEDRSRLHAAPGITCLWQISGRSEIPFEGQVKLDLEYIHAQSLSKDLWIMLRTLPAMISGRGAY